MGLPHSKTSRRQLRLGKRASVVECGTPMPLLHLAFLCSATSRLQPIQIPNCLSRNGRMRRVAETLPLGSFRPDGRQFARIQPVSIAIRALVHFDSPFGTEEMAHQLYSFATRAISFARRINHHIFVALDFKQMLPGAFLLLINPLKFKCVKPDAAATALTNVHLDTANLFLR